MPFGLLEARIEISTFVSSNSVPITYFLPVLEIVSEFDSETSFALLFVFLPNAGEYAFCSGRDGCYMFRGAVTYCGDGRSISASYSAGYGARPWAAEREPAAAVLVS